MPFEESAASFHPWVRGMPALGLLVVAMALRGVLAAPARADGGALRRRRLLRTAAADLSGSASGSPVVTVALLLGVAAPGMADFARREGENPPP